MRNIILISLVLILSTACDSNVVFKEYNKMDNISWNRFDHQNFELQVTKGEKLDLYFSLRHHTDLPYKYIDVNVTFYTPDGETRSRDYHFRLIGTDLKWKGEGLGELWDIDLPIRKGMVFNESGICKVRIENKMNKVETPGIIEVGLIAVKSD